MLRYAGRSLNPLSERGNMKSRNIVDYGVWMRKRERDLRALSGQPKRDSTLPIFSMAFQPIVHVPTRQVFAYESLVRSADGKGAASFG